MKRRRKRKQERAEEREEAAQGAVEERAGSEAETAVEPRKPQAIHVLDQWVDVLMEDGAPVTRLEPSNEQLLEDCKVMKPPPEQVARRFHFRDGIPDEYAWCFENEEQRISRKWGWQQMKIETWLAAIHREQGMGTGHLSDTGEDLPEPLRKGCWCTVCARNTEISRRRDGEAEEEEKGGRTLDP